MLSILVVSYNTRELLRQCLASLRHFAPTAQLIVIDNGSWDGSVEMVRSDFPDIEVVALPENLGFAAANNVGLRLAHGDPILLLNSDTVVEDDSLDRCAAWMREHPRVGALSPRLIGVDGVPQQCLYPFPSLARLLRTAIGQQTPTPEEDVADGWLAGTALFLRREALGQIGGQLDAGYFMYWEDADVCARLRERGWQRVVCSDAHVRHHGGSSSGAAAAPVRADLLAWDFFGRHHWFARHRPVLECVGLWLLDAIDVPRILLRDSRHTQCVRNPKSEIRNPKRETRNPRAMILLKVLWWRLIGRKPPRGKSEIQNPKSNTESHFGFRISNFGFPVKRVRVLLIAESCNPAWTSVPLVGYSLARALAEHPDLEVTLVTHVRNRPFLEADPLAAAARIHYIDNEWLARPLYSLSTLLRGGHDLSWTTNTAMAWLSYMVFEHEVLRRFRRRFRDGAFDLIHRLTPLSPTMGSPLASLAGVPMMLGPLNGGLPWPRDYPELRRQEREWLVPLRRAYKLLPYYRATYRHLAAVISGSRHTATEVPPYFQGQRFYLPENGIDTSRLPIAAVWPEPRGRFRFLTVGRLVPYKGVDLILQAMRSSSALGACELRVVGDGPQRGYLEGLTREYGLASRVCFTGWVDHRNLAQEFAQAQAFVFPSLREFGGGVVVEAMASGLPAVVVDYGGPGELLTPNAGVLLRLAPRAELVPRLQQAMEQLAGDASLCRALGQAAAERVRSELTWPAKAERIAGFYRQVLASSSKTFDREKTFMTMRDYFDRVRVINLAERTDRRRQITSELTRAGFPLEPGKVEIFPAIRPLDAAGFSNIGHHGCFLSHYEVIRQARDAQARNVLIVEDDLAIAPTFQTVAPALVESLQTNDWGIVYLGHTEGLKGNGAPALAPVPSAQSLRTTHFVGVNGQIFDVFLAFLERLRQRPPGHPDGGPMPIDGAYSTFRLQHPEVLTLLAVPNLGVQRSSRSDIADLKWFDRLPGLRGCVAALRRTKVWLKGR